MACRIVFIDSSCRAVTKSLQSNLWQLRFVQTCRALREWSESPAYRRYHVLYELKRSCKIDLRQPHHHLFRNPTAARRWTPAEMLFVRGAQTGTLRIALPTDVSVRELHPILVLPGFLPFVFMLSRARPESSSFRFTSSTSGHRALDGFALSSPLHSPCAFSPMFTLMRALPFSSTTRPYNHTCNRRLPCHA